MLIEVTLELWGDKLDPERITEYIGVAPSKIQRLGDSRKSKGKTIVAQTGRWSLSSRSQTKSESLQDHFDCLLNKLKDRDIQISNIPDLEDACIDVFLAITDQDNNKNPHALSAENLSVLDRLGLPIRFTFAPVIPE